MQVWSSSYHEASVALQGREEAVAAQAEAIETNLTLLGATAVEDRLQEGVPQAISTLSAAGIKVITHPAPACSCLWSLDSCFKRVDEGGAAQLWGEPSWAEGKPGIGACAAFCVYEMNSALTGKD